MLIKHWCYGLPFLESLPLRCVAKLTNCLIPCTSKPPAAQDHFSSEGSLSKKKKKRVVSFSAEHAGAVSAGLITRRKEMSKLKTRGRAPTPGRQDLTQNMGEKWKKVVCQEEVIFLYLIFTCFS